jgi:GTP-binding protein
MTQSPASGVSPGEALFNRPITFVKGVVGLEHLPDDDRPEVAFAGRSNVGKSSLINALANRRQLARASSEPGRTRELNYFDLDGHAFVVDLPGYGFAKAPKTEISRWTGLTRSFLRGRASLKRVFLLIDARRGIIETDKGIMALLDGSAVSYQIVLTKADKLKPSELDAIMKSAEAVVAKRPAAMMTALVTSAQSGLGITALKDEVAALIGYSPEA